MRDGVMDVVDIFSPKGKQFIPWLVQIHRPIRVPSPSSLSRLPIVHTPAVIYVTPAILTVPTQRNIRAIYRSKNCNATFRRLLLPFQTHLGYDSMAVKADELVKTAAGAASSRRIGTESLKQLHDILFLQNRTRSAHRVPPVENEAAIGAGKAV